MKNCLNKTYAAVRLLLARSPALCPPRTRTYELLCMTFSVDVSKLELYVSMSLILMEQSKTGCVNRTRALIGEIAAAK